jgi:hypothetical protein
MVSRLRFCESKGISSTRFCSRKVQAPDGQLPLRIAFADFCGHNSMLLKRIIYPIVFLLILGISGFAQSTPLTNDDILELYKAGVSERVILQKIKSFPTRFDTSTQTLIQLKSSGLSDSIILAMLDSRPVRLLSDQEEPKPNFTMRDAVKSRKVFISTTDKSSEMEIAREVSNAGFEVVPERVQSELVISFVVYKSTSPRSSYGLGNHWGRMTVVLRKDGGAGEIFTQQKDPSYWNSKNLHNQASRLVRIFLESLKSAETSVS